MTATAPKTRTIQRNTGRPVAAEAGSAKTSSNSAPAAVKAIADSML